MIYSEAENVGVTRLDDAVRIHFNRDRLELSVEQAFDVLEQLVQVLKPFPPLNPRPVPVAAEGGAM